MAGTVLNGIEAAITQFGQILSATKTPFDASSIERLSIPAHSFLYFLFISSLMLFSFSII